MVNWTDNNLGGDTDYPQTPQKPVYVVLFVPLRKAHPRVSGKSRFLVNGEVLLRLFRTITTAFARHPTTEREE